MNGNGPYRHQSTGDLGSNQIVQATEGTWRKKDSNGISVGSKAVGWFRRAICCQVFLCLYDSENLDATALRVSECRESNILACTRRSAGLCTVKQSNTDAL
jgi:hypothetical protein